MSTQDGWHLCSKCGGLIWPGVAACPSGGVHDHANSADYILDSAGGQRQGGWNWCSKCQTLGFTGTDGKVSGPCPAGGVYDHSVTNNYGLNISDNPDAGQGNWRWCRKCQGLFWAEGDNLGSYQAGGSQDGTGSGNYVLSMNGNPPVDGGQNKWKWCSKCMMLAYDGYASCAGVGSHINTGSDAYAINTTSTSSTGQTGWGICSQCYSLFYAGTGDSSGDCPGHSGHARLHGLDYALKHDETVQTGQQGKWAWCSQCQMLWQTGDTSSICPQTNASHISSGSLNYVLDLESTTTNAAASSGTPTSSSPPASSRPPSIETSSSSSSGAIAGIAVGAVAGCLVLGGALAYFYWRKRNQDNQDNQDGVMVDSQVGTDVQSPKAWPTIIERSEIDGRMVAAEADTAPVAAEME